MEKENDSAITEINRSLSEGLGQYADIMVLADADQWAYRLNYTDDDVLNVTAIFNHVLCNYGIKSGRITEENAAFLGSKLRKLVHDMTGLDPAEILSKP